VTARILECTYVLAALKDWTSILGAGFVVGNGNGLLPGYLMHRSGLVPRRLAMLGLIGDPLICASGIAVMFAPSQGGTGQAIAAIPGVHLGARPRPLAAVQGIPTVANHRAREPRESRPSHAGARAALTDTKPLRRPGTRTRRRSPGARRPSRDREVTNPHNT
jgi:hypothetical protein